MYNNFVGKKIKMNTFVIGPEIKIIQKKSPSGPLLANMLYHIHRKTVLKNCFMKLFTKEWIIRFVNSKKATQKIFFGIPYFFIFKNEKN